jgi:type IV pilus assembly protein PilC
MPPPKSNVAPKLVTFNYECKNNHGAKVLGEIVAANITLAKADLRRQGLNPIKVRKKAMSLFGAANKKKIGAADIAYFSRQMATMMNAGVPLVQSFDIVAKSVDNLSMRDLVLAVKADVEAGRSFSEALKAHPKYFDFLFCNLVAAGESSGSLDTMLNRIAVYKEKSESLKRKIKKALFYPAAVVLVALIISSILLIFVVPQFEHLFKGFGAELPVFTKMVIHLSNVVQKWWWAILMLFMLSGWTFTYCHRKYIKFRYFVDTAMLRLPIIGNILQKAVVARYARTLSTTFAAGVPLVEALESVAGATGNLLYADAVIRIKEEVSTGSQMQAAMRNAKIFPNLVIQMVAIGEESGSLDSMLDKVATIYEEEVDAAVDGLSTLLEPLIMAILGVLVGCLVIAMYLPIFKMGSIV